MEAEEVMRLYDSFWFELEIFNKIEPNISSNSSNSETNQDHQKQEKSKKSELLRIPTLHTRSMSDQLNSKTSYLSGSFSPDSVLLSTPKLNTILSGKETTEFESFISKGEHFIEDETINDNMKNRDIRRRKKKGESKSLSDLEFEELKGFMDLGFVFSEKDRQSSLVSIIPGLQRLGNKNEEEEEVVKSAISRPYLSEAWEVRLDKRKKDNPLMNWRVPSTSNEIDIKESLRWWAHTVASTVR